MTLVVSDVTVGFCGSFTISVSYSPSTSTTNLITVGAEVFAADTKTILITMADSETLLDEATYTISASAQYSSQASVLSSATSLY